VVLVNINRAKIVFLSALLTVTLLAAGCGTKSTPETKTAAAPQVGILNVDKAVQAHSKYADYQRLQKEYNTLAAQAAVEKQAAAQGQAQDNAMPDGALQGLNEALGQEFNSKVAAKQNEISVRLNQKADQVRRDLSGQFDAYTKEIDETYQSQIFSLQLKLKTVQLSKEEMEALQKQLEQLQGERSAKLAAKEKELSGQLEAAMAPEKAAAEKELSAYANEVNTALQQQAAAKSAEIAARTQTAPLQSQVGQGRTETEQKAALKSQEITVLQDSIIKDIQDKTAKIAAERGLEAVLGVYKVNVSAVDITDAVIAEIKK
jgi:hypothetical protein